MAYNLKDYVLTNKWMDLTTLGDYADMIGNKVTVQAKFVNRAYVFLGGTDEPEGDQGHLLLNETSVTKTADHWWVKGKGTLAISTED